MPVRPYHDNNLPQKPPLEAGKAAVVIAAIVGLAVVGLVLAYR